MGAIVAILIVALPGIASGAEAPVPPTPTMPGAPHDASAVEEIELIELDREEISAAAGCRVQLPSGGPIGEKICGTDVWGFRWHSDGTERAFVLGNDHAVWHIVRHPNGRYDGWRSLGGWGQRGVYKQFLINRNHFGINTIGRDGRRWCKSLDGGFFPEWTNWHRCPLP